MSLSHVDQRGLALFMERFSVAILLSNSGQIAYFNCCARCVRLEGKEHFVEVCQ